MPHYMRTEPATPDPTFRQSWDLFVGKEKTLLRLIAVGLGTLAFSMSDIVLEPYGGEVLKLGVGTTTLLSAIMAFGSLMGFAYASYILSLGADPFRMASLGAVIGLPAYGLIIMAAGSDTPELFHAGRAAGWDRHWPVRPWHAHRHDAAGANGAGLASPWGPGARCRPPARASVPPSAASCAMRPAACRWGWMCRRRPTAMC